MSIIFKDNIGTIAVDVNEDGIQFDGVNAYFTDTTDNDYIVEMQYIVSICPLTVSEYR